MPARLQPTSLYALLLHYITHNTPAVWQALIHGGGGEAGVQLCVGGTPDAPPLLTLPPVVKSLLLSYIEAHQMHKTLHHLWLFLHPGSEQLDATHIQLDVLHDAYSYVLAVKPRAMKRLALNVDQPQLNPYIPHLLQMMTDLQYLSLHGDQMSSDVMRVVGENLSQLQELNLNECLVSESDILQVVPNQQLKHNGCPHLQYLSFRTHLSLAGYEKLLSSLKHLEEIENVKVYPALCSMRRQEDRGPQLYERCDEQHDDCKLQHVHLKALIIDQKYCSSSDRGYTLCSQYCSKVHRLTVRCQSCYASLEATVNQFPHLNSLYLDTISYSSFELMSHLQNLGENLRELRVENLRGDFNLSAIVECCPLLTLLHLMHSGKWGYNFTPTSASYGSAPEPKLSPLPYLQNVRLNTFNDQKPDARWIKSILAAPSLQTLRVISSNCITDAVLFDVMKHQETFSNLHSLLIHGMSYVTIDFFYAILDVNHIPLEKLYIKPTWRAQEMSDTDIDMLQARIADRMLDVTLLHT